MADYIPESYPWITLETMADAYIEVHQRLDEVIMDLTLNEMLKIKDLTASDIIDWHRLNGLPTVEG